MRTGIAGGGGWKIINSPLVSLNAEVGFQQTFVDYRLLITKEDEQFSEGTSSIEFVWNISGSVKFKQTVECFVPFETVDDWRANSESSLSVKVSDIIWATIGYVHKSDQGAPKGIKKNDRETYLGISLEF